MKNKYVFATVLMVFGVLFAGIFVKALNSSQNEGTVGNYTVVTSFYPVYIAAANVVGECPDITLKNLSEPQTGCLHDFQLTPEDMKLLSTADLFFVNGGGMESFLTDVAEQYQDLTIVETAKDADRISENAHVWMSIKRYRKQVEVIADTLCQAVPKHEEEFRKYAAEYDKKLEELEAQQEEIKTAAEDAKVISFHEAYEYVADDYGLTIAYEINLDEERQISSKEAADVLSAASSHACQMILAEEQYGSELAEMVQKETGIEVYYLDTLVRGDYDLDSYLAGMKKNINLLKLAFGV